MRKEIRQTHRPRDSRARLIPKTKKYFGFSPSFTPDPVNWRKDLWDDVGVMPDSWEKILDGGRKIKQKHNIPVGLGLAQELDTSMALRTLCTPSAPTSRMPLAI